MLEKRSSKRRFSVRGLTRLLGTNLASIKLLLTASFVFTINLRAIDYKLNKNKCPMTDFRYSIFFFFR